MILKNTHLTLEIESVSGDGSGVGRVNGEVVFVPFSAKGDVVKCVIIKSKPNYSVGKILKIITPSPERKESDCEVFGKCGGCVFRHLTIKEEENIKTETVRSAMKRIGKIDVEVKKCITPTEIGYRNKAQIPVTEDDTGLHLGFYATHSHRVIDESINCVTAPKEFSEISKFIIDFMKRENISGYRENENAGVIRHLYFRINHLGKIMLSIVSNTKKIKSDAIEEKLVRELTSNFQNITSLFFNYNPHNTNVVLSDSWRLLWGNEYFEDELLGVSLKMSPDSFFQVNRKGAELIYKTAFSLLDEKEYENVYDLYCGIGSIGITLLSEMKKGQVKSTANRLFGIEIVENAIKNARENAKRNGIENAEFLASDSTDITDLDWFDRFPPSLVILDPPRKGTTEKLLDFLSERGVKDILYISCDPATLARDMSYLFKKGYTSSAVHPINIFAGTKHVECCVRLYKE